jgi:hypothetical protein
MAKSGVLLAHFEKKNKPLKVSIWKEKLSFYL